MALTSRFRGRPAAAVEGLAPYQPGKPISELERELGLTGTVKLASNENPCGASPAALAAARLAVESSHLYPDGGGFALKAALAAKLDVEPDRITLGNGSNDILVQIAEAFLGPGTAAVYSRFAFAIYALATRATGAQGREVPALAPSGPQPRGHDLTAIAAGVDRSTRVLFLANPNNPTGTWFTSGELVKLLDGVPGDVLVVLDEAYAEYVAVTGYPDGIALAARYPNLVVTRTFSKAYGLAGLRIGYAVSDPGVADCLNRVRQPFNVSLPGQAAAIAALADDAHIERSRAANTAGLGQLRSSLVRFGWQVPESAGNFVLADTGGDAGAWYNALLRRGVIVRPMAGYGLPGMLRITVGTPAQNLRLLDAIAAAVPEVNG